jgi:hypothetical protein
MSFLDRSPGAFIALANLVVYGVVAAEIWMWTAASVAAVASTLLLIIVCAGFICRAALRLMDDGASARPAPAPVVEAEPVAVERPVAPRRLAREVGTAQPV